MINFNFVAQIASIIAAFGIFFVIVQIRDKRRFLKAELINDLDESFSNYIDIYIKFFDDGEWAKTNISWTQEQLSDIFRYLTFFEKVHLLKENRVIDIYTIDLLFRYRFFRAVHNIETQNRILKNMKYNSHLLALFAIYEDWLHYCTKRKIKIPNNDLKFEIPENIKDKIYLVKRSFIRKLLDH